MRYDQATCFSVDAPATLAAQEAESYIICAFLAYVVRFPRGDKTRNTAKYAAQVLASVRSFYEDTIGRRPGLNAAAGKASGRIRAMQTGLRRLAPSPNVHRLPVLQHHLRAIRDRLDLKRNATHRALWALWCTQFQGVLRGDDLLRANKRRSCWNPAIDTHRRRWTPQIARDTQGRVLGPAWELRLPPTKTDQSGERGLSRTFVLDNDKRAISAARAVADMLRKDPHEGDGRMVPLFRDPRTGVELNLDYAAREFKRLITSAGYPELATGLHGLRKGGSTALANSAEGGEHVARTMGAWTSDSYRTYIASTQERLNEASLAVGRERGMTVAKR